MADSDGPGAFSVANCAPISIDRLPRDVGDGIADEEHDHVGDLLGFAEPFERNFRQDSFSLVGEDTIRHTRQNDSPAHEIDNNAARKSSGRLLRKSWLI